REPDDLITHSIVFDYERREKVKQRESTRSHSSSKIDVVDSRFQFKNRDFHSDPKKELDLEFVNTVIREGMNKTDYLVILLSNRYITKGWLNVENLTKILNATKENGNLRQILLGYDSVTLSTCVQDILKLESIIKQCNIPFMRVQWEWTFQSFSLLTGSEVQCRSSISIPRPKGVPHSISWVDAHDIADAIVKIMARSNANRTEKTFRYCFLRGPESLTLSDMCAVVSKCLNKVTQVYNLPNDQDTFPNLFIKDRLIDKQHTLRNSFITYYRKLEDEKTVITDNDLENILQRPPTNFIDFVNLNSYMFADLLELDVPSPPNLTISRAKRNIAARSNSQYNNKGCAVIQSLNGCLNIDEQENVVMDFLLQRSLDPNGQLFNVCKRFSNLFISNFNHHRRSTVEDELESFNMSKTLVNSFIERMIDILSLQVHHQILKNPSINSQTVNASVRDMRGHFYRVVEALLFKDIHPTLLSLYKNHYKETNDLFNNKCKNELQKCTPMHLGVPHSFCLHQDGPYTDQGLNSQHNYQPAISTLQNMTKPPHALVDCSLKSLIKAQDTIIQCINQYKKTFHNSPSSNGQDKEETVGADDLVPIMIYIIIKANITDLWCESKMIQDFVHESIMMGSIGYSYTTLEASIDYICSLDWTTLDKSFVQMEQQVRKTRDFDMIKQTDKQMRIMKGMSMSINASFRSPSSSSPSSSTSSVHFQRGLSTSDSDPNAMSAKEATELSSELLAHVIALYESIPELFEGRYKWGAHNELTNALRSISPTKVSQFVIATQELSRVRFQRFFVDDSHPNLLSVFLLNLYHVMMYHGILSHGSFPMLHEKDREQFMMVEVQYDVDNVTLTLDDVHCLMTGKGHCNLHGIMERFYRNEPALILLMNQCCVSSPLLHVYTVQDGLNWRDVVKRRCSSFLFDTCRFDHTKKHLLVPQQLMTFAQQVGKNNTDDIVGFLIDFFPEGSPLRTELLAVDIGDGEENYDIKVVPFCYEFYIKLDDVENEIDEIADDFQRSFSDESPLN
ncbi:hypothetical protein AKO1_001747, partial [Acrasis kona]